MLNDSRAQGCFFGSEIKDGMPVASFHECLKTSGAWEIEKVLQSTEIKHRCYLQTHPLSLAYERGYSGGTESPGHGVSMPGRHGECVPVCLSVFPVCLFQESDASSEKRASGIPVRQNFVTLQYCLVEQNETGFL